MTNRFARATSGTLAAILFTAACALADTQPVPCTGCYINASEGAAQVQAHQAIVQNALQQSMNDRLTQQQATQTLQRLQLRLQLQNDLNGNQASLQTILLEQQLQLLRLQNQNLARTRAHRALRKRKPH